MLVKEYRAKRNIVFDLELKLMLQAAPVRSWLLTEVDIE
jgi:hypothetical protein